jgi:hypothetical protein
MSAESAYSNDFTGGHLAHEKNEIGRFPVRRILLLLLLAVVLLPLAVRAQNTTSSLTGTVTDSSGASVAGADVTVANTATGVEYRAKTNQQGLYRVSQLPPGNYSMKVENAGFAPQTFPSITLVVDQQGRQDVKLSLGSASQTVSVNASAQLLDTVSSNQGQVISNKQIDRLALSVNINQVHRPLITLAMRTCGKNSTLHLRTSGEG